MKTLKEPFSALSHGLGVVLSVAALVVLLVLARGRAWHIVGFSLYGASLLLVYLSSTIYHSLRVGPRVHERLQILDHSAIFLLIAGSYAPICLVSLRGPWGWSLLGAVYGIALVGITIRLLWQGAPHYVRVLLYVAMGWMSVIAWGPLRAGLAGPGLAWLVAGGVVYSVGAVIYALDRPHLGPGRFSAHDLWHILVLAGSACHFMVMLRSVVPTP